MLPPWGLEEWIHLRQRRTLNLSFLQCWVDWSLTTLLQGSEWQCPPVPLCKAQRPSATLKSRAETPTLSRGHWGVQVTAGEQLLLCWTSIYADRRQAPNWFPTDFPFSWHWVPLIYLCWVSFSGTCLFPSIGKHESKCVSQGCNTERWGGLSLRASRLGSLRPVQRKHFEKEWREKYSHGKKGPFVKVLFRWFFMWMTRTSRAHRTLLCWGVAGGGALAEFSQVPLPIASMDKRRISKITGGNSAQGRGYRLLILSDYYPGFLLDLPLAVKSDSNAFTCLQLCMVGHYY